MKRLVRRIVVCIVTCCAALNVLMVPEAKAFGAPNVTLLLIPGLTWEYITPERAPNLHRMLQTGGAANVALPLWGSDLSGYMALGASSRALVNKEGSRAYQSGEPVRPQDEPFPVQAAQLYERQTGEQASGSIVLPGIAELKKINAKHPAQSKPGALGQSIRSLGGRVALIGNSDLGAEAYRPAAMTVMDESGQIAAGQIGQNLVERDEQAPFGIHTDYRKLFQQHENIKQRTNLIAIEPGDLTRLAAKRNELRTEQTTNLYLRYLWETDQLLGQLLDANQDRTLMVVSPMTMADVGIGFTSAGVLLMAGEGVSPGSMLSSNTTRQPGFVTIYDIAPTILSCLGLPDVIAGGAGEPIGTIDQVAPIKQGAQIGATSYFLQGQIHQLALLNQFRPLFVKGFAEATIVVAVIAFVLQLLGHSGSRWPIKLLSALLPVPLLYLLTAAWGFTGVSDMLWKLVAITVIFWAALACVKQANARLLFTSVMTIAILTLDMLQQGTWMAASVFGFDLLQGARYYGIGNEYMGILTGAALLVYQSIRQQLMNSPGKKFVAATGLALLVFLLSAPMFGTNAGGGAAAAVTFLYAWLQGADGYFSRKKWAWVAGGASAICVTIVLLHIAVPTEQQTHIGKAAALLFAGDTAALQEIISRKWSLNWRLLDVSIWGKVFWGTLLILMTEVYRKSYAVLPFVMGGITTFLFNDSGVIAAAGCMVFGAVWVLTIHAQPDAKAQVEQLSDEAIQQ